MCRRLERENRGTGLIDADHLNMWLRLGQKNKGQEQQEQQPSSTKAVDPPKASSNWKRKAGRANSTARDPFALLDFTQPASSLTASVEAEREAAWARARHSQQAALSALRSWFTDR